MQLFREPSEGTSYLVVRRGALEAQGGVGVFGHRLIPVLGRSQLNHNPNHAYGPILSNTRLRNDDLNWKL
jgi:hypothetical protein